eukprot:1158743-Pelagomonas_calceolata.AAC.34
MVPACCSAAFSRLGKRLVSGQYLTSIRWIFLPWAGIILGLRWFALPGIGRTKHQDGFGVGHRSQFLGIRENLFRDSLGDVFRDFYALIQESLISAGIHTIRDEPYLPLLRAFIQKLIS